MGEHVVVGSFQKKKVAFDSHKLNKIDVTKQITWWNKRKMDFLHKLPDMLIPEKKSVFVVNLITSESHSYSNFFAHVSFSLRS